MQVRAVPMPMTPHSSGDNSSGDSSGDSGSGDRIRTCDLWVMSYAPGVFACSCGLKSPGQQGSGVRLVAHCCTDLGRFRSVLFPNLFPNLAGGRAAHHQATRLFKRMTHPTAVPRMRSAVHESQAGDTTSQRQGGGWIGPQDLPLFSRKRSQERDVCAGQAGRTGRISRVQSTRYDWRGGYRADESDL
jgi:hypothetical protein